MRVLQSHHLATYSLQPIKSSSPLALPNKQNKVACRHPTCLNYTCMLKSHLHHPFVKPFLNYFVLTASPHSHLTYPNFSGQCSKIIGGTLRLSKPCVRACIINVFNVHEQKCMCSVCIHMAPLFLYRC